MRRFLVRSVPGIVAYPCLTLKHYEEGIFGDDLNRQAPQLVLLGSFDLSSCRFQCVVKALVSDYEKIGIFPDTIPRIAADVCQNLHCIFSQHSIHDTGKDTACPIERVGVINVLNSA